MTLTDALDRTVEFDTAPQRIVIAGKSSLTIVDTLYLFPQTSERLVGLVVGKQPVGDFVSLVDPAWDQKTTLAPDAGPEQIAPLEPDVVLLRSFMADSLGRAVEELGIPVVYLDLETPEQYFRDVAVLGQLMGDLARAEAIQDYYQSGLDRVEQAVAGTGEDQRPRALLVQYSEQGGEVGLNVPSAAWLQTMEVELAGGAPVWKEAAPGGGWTVVNFEQIAAWDPDQILVVSYKADSAQVVEKLKSDPQWQALQAVQGGAIHGFPGDIFSWDQPDPRWILGVTWLASKIHPDRFPELDMEQEAVEFFGEMYGMEEEAVETSILPKVKGNLK
jgi:iron complex transport system substrate-binding protein